MVGLFVFGVPGFDVLARDLSCHRLLVVVLCRHAWVWVGRCGAEAALVSVCQKRVFAALLLAEEAVFFVTHCAVGKVGLKRSARAVQLFGRLAVLETHTFRYSGPLGASWGLPFSSAVPLPVPSQGRW